MSCPTSIESTPRTASKSFFNWARKINFTASESFQPRTRGEIVEIIRRAEADNRRVKWHGSRWSFTESMVSNDIIIESENINGEIDPTLILDRLELNVPVENLIQVKGGTKIFNINRILHGLTPAGNGGGADEADLTCGRRGFRNKALPTLGGSGGQSIAGLLATGSHGGDIRLTPMADAVVAIHLIGPGGQEWWIESASSSLTSGTEAAVQARLRSISDTVDGASAEICNDIMVKKDDDFFRSVLVSVGRMGFVYSLVIRTVDAFKLVENRSNNIWEDFSGNLSAARFADFITERSEAIGFQLHFLQVLVNPFANNAGRHECKVAERHVVPCSAPNSGIEESGGFDIMSFICRQQDIRIILPILLGVLGVLGASMAGLLALAGVLSVIPFVGWALAAASYAAAAALGVTIGALTGLIAYLTVSGRLTSGELVAAISNFAYSFGLKSIMKSILGILFNGAYPILSKLGVSWKIMDTYGYSAEDFCQKVDSMEFAFDVSNEDGGGYLQFIQSVFTIFDDLYDRNIEVAGLMALRFTRNTAAKIAMSRFSTTCHIEIPILQNFRGNPEFLERVMRAAISFNGAPHWGQMMYIYEANDIRNIYGEDLLTWRRTLSTLIRAGAGNDTTFSNSFTQRYNLEPLDEVALRSITVNITVGDDSLGDTDWLRSDVSEDFLVVTLRDGREVSVSLNEGLTWNARSTHTRSIDLPDGVIWENIDSLRIKHHAAGNDWNADNWTMNRIIISTTDVAGVTRERYSEARNPIFQFQKNSNQVWEHRF